MTAVHIKKIKTGRIETEIKAILAYLGYLPEKKRIFIKPNIAGFYHSESPCIVNPRVVGGVIEYFKDLGYRDILIGELPVPKDTQGVFGISGYRALSKKYNVALDDLSSMARVALKFKDATIGLPEFLLDGQYEYINVAKMKTHIQTKVSLCAKNQKGLLDFSGRRMMHVDGDLHDNIRFLGALIKPDFCIIDGINALEGDGPGADGREVKRFHIVLAGRSMEAVDWVAAQVMGLDPAMVKHLSKPSEEIQVRGESIVKVKRNFVLPRCHFQKFHIHLWLTDKTCSGCSGIMGGVKRSLMRSPLRSLKLLCQVLFGRLDILTGGVDIPEKHGKIICVGNCMQEIAELHHCTLVRGCPPESKDLLLKL
jgi:uncharacterized protein (DUF362 family)